MSKLMVAERGRDVTVQVLPDGSGYLQIISHDHGVCVHPPKMTPEEARVLAAMLDNAASTEDEK